MPSNKPLPRFVPTLTEVVRTGVARPAPPLDRERLIEQVLQTVKPRLEQQLRQSLGVLIDEQIRQASPQWRIEIEATVESVVAQALAQRGLDKL
jgi:hypothetical protein